MLLKWSKVQHEHLTRFVLSKEAREHLPLSINIHDLQLLPDGRTEIARHIYQALVERGIQYARAKYEDESQVIQYVRTPSEILGPSLEGTCLDLTLLFCGLCLEYELLPVLVMLKGNAFVAVSRNHGLREWKAYGRREYEELFKYIKTTDYAAVRELVESGVYFAVECTGFARSKSLLESAPEGRGRLADGTLSFERAVEAGHEHLCEADGRSFSYALDIPVARYLHKLDPYTDAPAASAPARHHPAAGIGYAIQPKNLLSNNLNRSDQVLDFKHEVLRQRREKPTSPLICIIHGNEDECHSELLERLWEFLRPILKYCHPAKARALAMKRYTLDVSLKKVAAAAKAESFLWSALAESVVPNRLATESEVLGLVTSKKSAAMINVSLKDWQDVDCNALHSFFEFWNNWRGLPPDFLLLICLCVRYQKPREGSGAAKSVEAMRDYINGLGDFGGYEYIHGTVISELRAVERPDVEALLDKPRVRKFYPGLDYDAVRILYGKYAEGRIPMDTLLSDLGMYGRV